MDRKWLMDRLYRLALCAFCSIMRILGRARFGVLLALMGFCSAPTWAAVDVLVYVPSVSKAHAIRNEMGSACDDVNAYVFSNGSDFRRQMKRRTASAVLSLPPVLEKYPDYQVTIQGQLNQRTAEKYLLVSTGEPLALDNLDGKIIGVYDFLGRRSIRAFFQDDLGPRVRLKTVRKVVDLLSLLVLEEADGILVSRFFLEFLQERSHVELFVTELTIERGVPALALRDASLSATFRRCFKGAGQSLNMMLGVHSWDLD